MRRLALIAGGVLLLVAVVVGLVLSRGGDDPAPTGLTVDWGGSEGHPPCVYDPETQTVLAKVTIDGTSPGSGPVTMTVTATAYADENTSRPVGSGSTTVQVEGTVHTPVEVTIPVRRAPHVDEDQVAACTHSEKY